MTESGSLEKDIQMDLAEARMRTWTMLCSCLENSCMIWFNFCIPLILSLGYDRQPQSIISTSSTAMGTSFQ